MLRHKVILRVISLIVLAFGGACGSFAQTPDSITFGVIGDQTFSTNLQASYVVMQSGVSELSHQNLRVVLHCGDLLESSVSPAEVQAQFQQATGILDRLPVPWYMTAGDHDVNPPGFQQDSPDRSREQLWQQLYGARVPAVLSHPFYSFDVGTYHFIALYSHEALHADPRFGNIFLAQLYEDQYNFLKNDLENHKSATAIIVFIHQALWYHVSGWQRVHELLRQYPVSLVISGHHHYNQDYGTTDGIRYITVGATGGATKTGSREAGDVQHVAVIKMSGSKVSQIKLVSVSDNKPLNFTPRVDMDRVQALDVQLGNLFDFAQNNPVFFKNGQLVRSCTDTAAATLSITPLGDPIDLPLDVKLTFSTTPAGVVTLSNPAFGTGQCSSVISNTECILPRTARTMFSNYSSVQVVGDECVAASCVFLPVTPLWTSGLSSAGSGPTAGTVLKLNVRTTFQGASGSLFLFRDVTTTVQACP